MLSIYIQDISGDFPIAAVSRVGNFVDKTYSRLVDISLKNGVISALYFIDFTKNGFRIYETLSSLIGK